MPLPTFPHNLDGDFRLATQLAHVVDSDATLSFALPLTPAQFDEMERFWSAAQRHGFTVAIGYSSIDGGHLMVSATNRQES